MGRITILCVLVSTVIVLVTFTRGIEVLHGGDVASHLSWAVAALVSVLGANFIAIVHAAQSDRIIRTLRRQMERASQNLLDDRQQTDRQQTAVER